MKHADISSYSSTSLMMIGQRTSTLLRCFQNVSKYNARGIIQGAAQLIQLSEGEWIPTPWDYNSGVPASSSPDIHPHLLKIKQGRAIVRATDTAIFSSSNRMVGFGTSSYLHNQDDEYLNLREHPYYRRIPWQRPFEWLPEPQIISKLVFLLHSPWRLNNYYHFLIDFLPRLGIFLSWQAKSSDEPAIVTSLPVKGYRAEVLARTGAVPKSKRSDPLLHIQAEHLYTTSLARTNQKVSKKAVDYLRSLFQDEINNPLSRHRKIYIWRGSSAKRPLQNEKYLAQRLEQHGYEIVSLEKFTVADQARLFATASVVVAQHGAGLTNTSFCRPDCTILELCSPTWHLPLYKQIAKHVEGKYIPFQCQASTQSGITVDLDALIQIMANHSLL